MAGFPPSGRAVLRRIACSATLAAVALTTSVAQAEGPADFLVDRLSMHEFRGVIQHLSDLETRWWRRPKNERTEEYVRDALLLFGYPNVVMHEYTYSGRTRHNVYATRVGSVRPNEMYIIGAHIDSYNRYGDYDHCPGANDDASGVAAVLEAARVFARARPEVSVRFVLWNNEETGLNGSRAYVAERRGLQGTPEEPTWLGMIQLDMILYDHGPGPVPDADVEYQTLHDYDGQAVALADAVAGAMARYGDIPAEVGDNMSNTDSVPFWDDTAAVSIRENQRISEIGEGSSPHWHEPTDLYETYTDEDYAFGFNIVKMLVGSVGELAGAAPLGDVDRDGDVDLSDLNALLASYRQCEGDPDYNGDADFDQSGCVDLSDLAELLGNYGVGV